MTKETSTDKDEAALKTVIGTIEKQFGKGSIMRMGDRPDHKFDIIPTGSLGLDIALGIGGYPKGRIIELWGPESAGKTTLALHAVAEAQKQGGRAAYIDAEHALDPTYAAALGVDIENMYISQPDSGEEALEIVDKLIEANVFDIVVVDSVAALVPKAELEGEMGQSHMGLQARLMSQALRKLKGKVHNTQTVLFFINQVRMKIGVVFGNPEVTAGGNALKYYASVRLEIKRIGALKDGDAHTGNKTRVKVVKNKVSPPMKEAAFDIVFGQGIDYVGELLDKAEELNLVEKSGAWYSYKGERIGQGRDNSVTFVKENIKVLSTMKSEVAAGLGI